MRNKDSLSRLLERSAMPIPAPPPTEISTADMQTSIPGDDWILVDGLFCEGCNGPAFRHPDSNMLMGCKTCGFTVRAFTVLEKFTDLVPTDTGRSTSGQDTQAEQAEDELGTYSAERQAITA